MTASILDRYLSWMFPTVLGVYWPRMNKAGCLAGLLGGFLSFLVQYVIFIWRGLQSFGGFDPFIWSLLVSVVSIVAVTLLTPAGPERLRQRYFSEAT